MSNRQKIYVGLAVSAGVCSGIALFLYLRHRRQIALSKTPETDKHSITPASILSSIKSRRGHQYSDITSSSIAENDAAETVRFQSNGATVEVDIPGGGVPLTSDQAIILTRLLDENKDDIEKLHRILTSIANAATLNESQINLANAGCIDRLRDIILTTDDTTTKCKTLLALNNLALNDYAITHFSGIVTIVINLCHTTPPNSLVRLYGLNLLINMSVLEYLHDEYMKDINELGLLIESTFQYNEEALSAGKILANLSANKLNVEDLLKMTGIELRTIVNMCATNKKSIDHEQILKLEDILLRYLTFYCNLSEAIVNELKQENDNNSKSWLNHPIPYRQGALYFELFDHDKQMSAKSILRPQYSSNTINTQIKRLRQAMDTIRQIQFESTVTDANDEFNQNDYSTTITESSTPKKSIINDNNIDENPLDDLEKEINDQFKDDDDKTIAAESPPSDPSLASYRSADSTLENNTFTSPEKSIPT